MTPGAQMTAYRFFLFDVLQLVRELERPYADDLDALDAARDLSSGFTVEVYDAERFVARVNIGDEPMGVGDRIRRDADIRPDHPLIDAES
jgi:hypothetical protein